ncbi:MAG: hypothetical protein ACOX1R_02835 [Caldicoprobacterales bacterium]|jgi:hypothetical protein|nr:hypothetical protein [Clostridiales bacterium]
MTKQFPRTEVGGVSLSRMIIGTNWILGYSHTTVAADNFIRQNHDTPEKIANMLEVFLESGVDTIMGPFNGNPMLVNAVRNAEDRTGRGMIIIDTPIINVDNSPEARAEAEKTIAASKKLGATFCLPHHSSVEELVNKNKKIIDRLPDYLAMIRDHDMVPGLSAHMPELVVYSDLNNYDVETYIQIYNCMGFLMQVEVEYIHKVIWDAKKPVMTIKPMAAGRVSPFVGLTFSWHTIRPCDMVTVGCLTPDEAREDIEISLAALESRRPDLEGRSSPKKTDIMK